MTENVELTPEELEQLDADQTMIVDIRDESNRAYGMIPGAIAMAEDAMDAHLVQMQRAGTVVVY